MRKSWLFLIPVLTIYAHFQNRLDRMQQGLNPYDWKPFSTIGPVCERFVLAMLMGSIASCMSQNLKKRLRIALFSKENTDYQSIGY